MGRLQARVLIALFALGFAKTIYGGYASTSIDEYSNTSANPVREPLTDSQELITTDSSGGAPLELEPEITPSVSLRLHFSGDIDTNEAIVKVTAPLHLHLSLSDEIEVTPVAGVEQPSLPTIKPGSEDYMNLGDKENLSNSPPSLFTGPSKHPRALSDYEQFENADPPHKKVKQAEGQNILESALSQLSLDVPCPELIMILMSSAKYDLSLIKVRNNLLLNIPQVDMILNIEVAAKHKEKQEKSLALATRFRTTFDKVALVAEQQLKDLKNPANEEQLKLKWCNNLKDIIEGWAEITKKDKQLALQERELQDLHAVRMKTISLLADTETTKLHRKKVIETFRTQTEKLESERKENINQAESFCIDLEDILADENAYEAATVSLPVLNKAVQSQINPDETIFLCQILRAYSDLLLSSSERKHMDVADLFKKCSQKDFTSLIRELGVSQHAEKNLKKLQEELEKKTMNYSSTDNPLLKTYTMTASKFIELLEAKRWLLVEKIRQLEESLPKGVKDSMKKKLP